MAVGPMVRLTWKSGCMVRASPGMSMPAEKEERSWLFRALLLLLGVTAPRTGGNMLVELERDIDGRPGDDIGPRGSRLGRGSYSAFL